MRYLHYVKSEYRHILIISKFWPDYSSGMGIFDILDIEGIDKCYQ